MTRRFILTILGRAGSGKTDLTKAILPACPRPVMCIDTMAEFNDGVQFESAPALAQYIVDRRPNVSGIYVLNAQSDKDAEAFFRLCARTKSEMTIVVDEASKFCSPNYIDPHLNQSVQYGRHWRQNLIFNARRPAEISRHLTAQSDAIISFRQTEPRDVKQLAASFEEAEFLPDLDDHEFLAFDDWERMPFADILRRRRTAAGSRALVDAGALQGES